MKNLVANKTKKKRCTSFFKKIIKELLSPKPEMTLNQWIKLESKKTGYASDPIYCVSSRIF